MSMNTSNLSAISPDQIEQLVVQPVQANSSTALQAGTLVTTDATRTKIPRVTQDPSASWVAEGEEIGTSDPAVDDITVTPEKLAGLVVVSTEAAEDTSPAAADMIGDGLARDIAKKLDAAFFGSAPGGTAQPNGLEDLDDVTEVDAGDAWEDLDPFAAALSNAEGHRVGLQLRRQPGGCAGAVAAEGVHLQHPAAAGLRCNLGDASGGPRRPAAGVLRGHRGHRLGYPEGAGGDRPPKGCGARRRHVGLLHELPDGGPGDHASRFRVHGPGDDPEVSRKNA